MKGSRRFATSSILVALLVVGLVGGLFLAGQKPKLGLDLEGGLSVVLQAPHGTSGGKMDEARTILLNRVDRSGVTEPEISRQGSNQLLIEIPHVKDPNQILKLIGQTAQLEFRGVTGVIAQGSAGYATATVTQNPLVTQTAILEGAPPDTNKYEVTAVPGTGAGLLTGAGISSASASVDTTDGFWTVNLSFKSAASTTWAQLTGQVACKQASDPTAIAIILDNQVQSSPGVNSSVACGTGIASGTTSITGSFTETQAKSLALVLSTGALPVKLTQIDEQNISATLGKQSLRAGIDAGLLGLILVMLYVAIYYRSLGLQTWIGLTAFSGLMYGLVVLLGDTLGFTLSLAGIAGLIVAVGITTDSYVVFFERIKEEVHQAKTLRSSVDRGYKSALRTLFTADTVTFFAAVILYLLAVGDVKGFAFTLGVATILDVFLFITLTYPLAGLLARTKTFSEGRLLGMRRAMEGTGQEGLARKIYRSEFNIDFIGRRKLWLSISGALVAISVLALIPGIRGLQFGIDFKGGNQFTVPLSKTVTVAQIDAVMTKVGVTAEQVQIASSLNSGKKNAVIVTRALPAPSNVNDTTVSLTQKVENALAAATGTPVDSIGVEAVSGTWGSSVTTDAVRALIVFLIVVTIYMSWRLEPKMAVSGSVALIHDLVITAGVYAIVGLQVTPDTVIAVLTILGYSLYDTVVVFDKIKENVTLPSSAKRPYDLIANDAMNQVFMRSINTSLTTLLPVGSLLFIGSFLLGAETLRELALALFVGIAAGTYSSIFVATPLLSIMKEKEPRYASLKAARLASLVAKPGTKGTGAGGGPVAEGGGVAVGTLERATKGPAGSSGTGGGAKGSGGSGASGVGSAKTGARRPPPPRSGSAAKGSSAAKSAGAGAEVPAKGGSSEGSDEAASGKGPGTPASGGSGGNGIAEVVASVKSSGGATTGAPKVNRPPQRRPNQSRAKRKKGRR